MRPRLQQFLDDLDELQELRREVDQARAAGHLNVAELVAAARAVLVDEWSRQTDAAGVAGEQQALWRAAEYGFGPWPALARLLLRQPPPTT